MKVGPYDLPGAYTGDAVGMLGEIPDESIHRCITSPPYWGLRSYLPEDSPQKGAELGAEKTIEEYVANMVEVFREVRRVLRDDGTLWLNLGDCYAATGKSGGSSSRGQGAKWDACGAQTTGPRGGKWSPAPPGLKPKDLCLIPYRVALALQADGWYLRSNIVWAKGISFCESYSGRAMPESIKDRPTSAHESVFLLSKSERYYYDQGAVREALRHPNAVVKAGFGGDKRNGDAIYSGNKYLADQQEGGRNLRNVWVIPPNGYKGSHYAVFPPELVVPMVEAGCPIGGVVLDPFMGSGTTGQVAESRGRLWLGFDLDERNAKLIKKRTAQTSLLGLATVAPSHR